MLGGNGGKRTQLRGRLHLDLMHQGCLIPNNVNVRLILTQSRQEFFMMPFVTDQTPFKITIESANIEARMVKLAPSEQLQLECVLALPSGALIPITHVVVKNFTLGSGAATAENDSMSVGQNNHLTQYSCSWSVTKLIAVDTQKILPGSKIFV